MKKRPRHRLAVLVVLLTLSLMVMAPALPSVAANDGARADLYKLFDVEDVGANIVVAADTSLSMKGNFGAVRQALDGFSRDLGPNDRLTIITFDNEARKVYDGPADETGKIRAAYPKAPDPKGQKTNIGAAVDQVLTELTGGEGKLPVVVFLTDGMEDAPPESEFAIRPGEAWANLKDRAATQEASKEAYVLAIGLSQDTDIDRLEKIWPQTRPISIETSELGTHFRQLKENIRRERLKHKVGQELDSGRVSVTFDETDWGALRPGTTHERQLVVESKYKTLPVEVDLSGLSWKGFQPMAAGAAVAPGGGSTNVAPELIVENQKFVLGPGERRTIPVKVVAPRGDDAVDLKEEEEWRGRLKVAVTAETPLAPKIAQLGIEPGIKTSGEEREILFSRTTGIALYVFILVGLAALTTFVLFGRYAVNPAGQLLYRGLVAPPLFGRLAFSAAPKGEKLPRPVNLDGVGRRATLGANGTVALAGEGVEPVHAELFTVWDEGEAKVFIRPRDGTVRVARSVVSTPVIVAEETELHPGSLIQIGEYRLQWS